MREIKSTEPTFPDTELSLATADDNKTPGENVVVDASTSSLSSAELTKNFDDSCFKAPLPPQKKAVASPTKKRLAGGNGGGRLNGHIKPTVDDAEGEAAGKPPVLTTSLQRLSIDSGDDAVDVADDEKLSPSELCVSIGKDSYLCPYARQYFSVEFPDLVLEKKTTIKGEKAMNERMDDDEPVETETKEQDDQVGMLLEEVIIDGFSLLLFTSADDYDVIKELEKLKKERARAEDKRRAHENNARLGKLKNSRKNKVDADKTVRKEERDLKERERQERREARRQRKEQKERLARDKQERRDRLQQLSAEERLAEKRREKRERREAIAAALTNGTGPSTSAMADTVAAFGGGDMTADVVVELNGIVLPPAASRQPRSEKSKEELRRLKREKKLQQMKQQLKQETFGAADENSRHSVNANQHGICVPSLAAGTTGNAPKCSADSSRNMTALSAELNAADAEDGRPAADPSASISSVSSFISGALLNGCVSAANDAEALKRLASSSAIGIAQQNRVILSPMDNVLDGSRNGDATAANKIRKLETGINDFLNAHQHQLSGNISGGVKLPPAPNNNLPALKTEIKMENGHAVAKNLLLLNNSTANSQRSTPLSKETPLSADHVNCGNSAPSSTGPQLSAVLQTPSTSSGGASGGSSVAAALTLSQLSKQLSVPGGVDASTLAVIQQLFGGAQPTKPLENSAASLLQQQQLLLSHPELLSKGSAQKANSFDANLMATALNSDYPLLNYQQHLLQQQQQLEQSQKRSISNAAIRLPAPSDVTPKLGADAIPTSLLPPGFPAHLLAGTDSVMSSVAANTANLAKSNKTGHWADRHVSLATKIARESDHRRNLAVATQFQQQLLGVSSQQQQQQLLQQKLLQQQQLSMAFLPSNSKQVDAVTTAQTTSVTTNSNNGGGRKRSDNSTDHISGLPYKKPNLGQAAAPTLTGDQQRQQHQQVLQMNAVKKQQQQLAVHHQQQQSQSHTLQQQQQLQLEAQRRLQQQQQQHGAQNAPVDLFAQLQQQHLQQFKQLQQQQQQKLQSTSAGSRLPTAVAKTTTCPSQPHLPNGMPGTGPATSSAAQSLVLPASFLNTTTLFHPGASKFNHNILHANVGDQRSQQQPQQSRPLPQQQPLGYATPSATPQNMLPSLSMVDPLSHHLGLQLHGPQTMMGPMGFPIANAAHNAVAGGSLTSGTSAQAAALATANVAFDPTATFLNNLMSLQQQHPNGSAAQNPALNNSVLTQMAVAQLMMQQMGTPLPTSAATAITDNSLASLQSRQQQITTNNILASLGMLSNPGTPGTVTTPSSLQSQATHFGQLQSQPQQQQPLNQASAPQRPTNLPAVAAAPFTGITTAASAAPPAPATTTATSTATAPSNSISRQQQQDLILQAALLHGIQSLESKQQRSAIDGPNGVADRSASGVQFLLTEQLQHQLEQQQLLDRLVGMAGPNVRGMC